MNAMSATVTPAVEFLDTCQVEQYARLSYATLKRRHREGYDTGLRKRGRRVLFHIPTLTKFLLGESVQSPMQDTGNVILAAELSVTEKHSDLESFRHNLAIAIVVAFRFAARHCMVSLFKLLAEILQRSN